MECATMNVFDVAKITGRNVETVRKWCRNGTLKARKPAGTRDYIISRSDFNTFWGITPEMAGRDNASE